MSDERNQMVDNVLTFNEALVEYQEYHESAYPSPRMVPKTVSQRQGEVSDEPMMFHIRNFQWAKDEWRTREQTNANGDVEGDGEIFQVIGWVVKAGPVFTHIASMRVESEERGVEFNGGMVVPSMCVVEMTRLEVME